MRRTLRILGWALGVVLLLPVLAVALVFAALNVDAGRDFAARTIGQVTGGMVVVQGIEGRFPDHLRLRHLEIRDADGAWLLADGIALDWHPTRLLQRVAHVERLEAAHLAMPRLPKTAPDATPAPATNEPFRLPVHVIADRIHIARAEIGAPVAGAPAVLSAEARVDLPSLNAGSTTLVLQRLDGEGRYTLEGVVDQARIEAKLTVAEPDGGFLGRLASLPSLGPVAVDATLSGPRNAVGTTLALSAGPLRAGAKGTVDLVGESADLQVDATAPAMSPAPDVRWQSVAVEARVRGPFTKPDAKGRVRIEGLDAAGAGLRRLVADIEGNAGRVGLHAAAEGLRIPGPNPALLEAQPLTLDATIRLDDPTRPVTFTLRHKLLSAEGDAKTGGDITGTARLRAPDLTPLAALGGIELHGSTELTVKAAVGAATTIEVDGPLRITGGLAPIPGLVGDAATLGLTARITGADVAISRLELAGRTLRLSAQGGMTGGTLDVQARAGLTDLAVVAPTLVGAIQAEARVRGRPDRLAVDATVTGDVGAPGVPRGPVKLTASLTGLPGAPVGRIAAEGTLAGQPLQLGVNARRDADGTLHATIGQAVWRSLHADGALRLPPGATLPLGRVSLKMTNLDDLRPFIGQPLAGGVTATAELDEKQVRLQAELTGVGLPGNRVRRGTVDVRVADPLGRAVVTAAVSADGIDAGGATGSAKLDVTGPQDALAIRLSSGLTIGGTAAQVTAAALLNAVAKQATVSALQVTGKGETARLLAPMTIRFADGVAVDRLRIGVRQAVLDVAGRLSPRLDATVTLRTPADIAAIVAPDLALDGAIDLDAKLTGTPAQPSGTVRLSAAGLRMRSGPGRAVPPANVTATAQLAGTSARIDARLAAGSAQLAVNGTAPLAAGALNLRATGSLDLRMLDPILTAAGRQARGRLSLDATIAGTAAAPRISGTAQLAEGEVQDFTQGARISNIAASLRAEGDTVRIVSLTGRAGPGSIAASGSIGVLAPDMPVDLTVTLRNARPLASDRLTADLDADLTVRGALAGALQAGGRLLVRRAEIRIPESLPASIATLDVRRPGQRPPAAAASGPNVTLDLTVEAPQQVFVRGRGVDAEMSGSLRIRGNAAAPQVGGGLEMRRGNISVAGTTLNFTRGKVGFDGTGVTGKIDPTLDFAAESTAGGVTATLTIGGYASKPTIKLSSVPDLPQDEVLAYLIFKRSAKELGPFQIAEIAAALAQLSGVGGTGGLNPLESVRKGLGLDRLSVGAGSTSSSAPTVEAGRYVANGVYVGAKQGTTGGQTQATVQIDITKGLKLETDVGSGTGGNQVGVTYQFEY